jgi:hypothetical protein
MIHVCDSDAQHSTAPMFRGFSNTFRFQRTFAISDATIAVTTPSPVLLYSAYPIATPTLLPVRTTIIIQDIPTLPVIASSFRRVTL